jgi:hypothetical protein
MAKSHGETYALGPLTDDRAKAVLLEMLPSQAPHLVQVRAQDARMIACLVARANVASVRVCRSLGFDLKRGATGVFGLLGEDAARLFSHLPSHHREWLAAPCGPRETKVLVIAGGIGLLSLVTRDGKVEIAAVPP